MSKESSEIKVGLYVGVGLVLFVATVLLLGGNQFVFKKQIHLKTQFKQVQGLSEGSLVSLAGIPVGYVQHLEIGADEESVIAHLDLDHEFSDHLTTATVATMKTQGALGDRYIYLSPKNGGSPLSDGDFIAADNQPDFLDAISERTSDFEKIGELIREITSLVKNMNDKNRSALLMENLTRTSQNLSGITADPNIEKSVVHLSRVLKKIDQGEGTLGKLINDSALYDKLLGLLGESPRNLYLKTLMQQSAPAQSAISK